MDSINRNQPEDNRDDLTGPDALEKLRELAKGTCFFCTRMASGASNGARPMAVQKVDDHGDLWFLSAIDSHKNHELEKDPRVELFFQGSSHSDFLHLIGTASVTRDRAKIDELWNPLVKTWFTKGKEDPRITVVRVRPSQGYYWDTKHGGVVAMAKIVIGAAIGKTMDDSIEGRIDVR